MPKHTTIIDKGWKRIMKEMKHAKGSYTKVGVQLGTSRRGEDAGESMAEIAFTNEFGSGETRSFMLHGNRITVRGVPSRSFLRSARDENEVPLNRMIRDMKDRVLRGEITTRRALGLIGLWMEQKVKAKIRSNIQPANSPAVARAKQKRNPGPVKTLIDTGQLHQSIRHVEVVR